MLVTFLATTTYIIIILKSKRAWPSVRSNYFLPRTLSISFLKIGFRHFCGCSSSSFFFSTSSSLVFRARYGITSWFGGRMQPPVNLNGCISVVLSNQCISDSIITKHHHTSYLSHCWYYYECDWPAGTRTGNSPDRKTLQWRRITDLT